jgi:NitT/TauT family transport system substrate-binding protein
MQMLSDNKVDAAVLPEPLATLAISQGARSVIADTGTDIGPTNTLVFKASVISDQGDAVRRFLAAYDEAVVKINKNFDNYRQLLVDRKILNAQVETTFVAMPFPTPAVPTSKEVEQFSNWLVAKGIISVALDYGTTVDATFLTK